MYSGYTVASSVFVGINVGFLIGVYFMRFMVGRHIKRLYVEKGTYGVLRHFGLYPKDYMSVEEVEAILRGQK